MHLKMLSAEVVCTDELSMEANSVDPEQTDLGPHCLPEGFLNISADKKSRRLLLRLAH